MKVSKMFYRKFWKVISIENSETNRNSAYVISILIAPHSQKISIYVCFGKWYVEDLRKIQRVY